MSNQKEYKGFEIKAVDYNNESKELVIKGYAATFGNQDAKQMTWNNDIGDYVMCSDTIERGAFTKTISERKERIAFCKNHNLSDPKGKIIELKEDSYGLYIEVRISDAEPELKTKLKEGIYKEFSIGYVTIGYSFEKLSDGNYTRKLTEVKLYEVSVVTIARDENAIITEVKSIEILDYLILKENNEEKKSELQKLKSLITSKPIASLAGDKPTKEDVIDFNKLNFK